MKHGENDSLERRDASHPALHHLGNVSDRTVRTQHLILLHRGRRQTKSREGQSQQWLKNVNDSPAKLLSKRHSEGTKCLL